MYRIYTDGTLLGDSRSRNYAILSGAANLAVNSAGSMTFTIGPTNLAYMQPQKLASIITLKRDDEEVFRGRVLDWNTDFYNCRQFICEGALAFLRDVLKPPFTVKSMAPKEYLRRLLEQYNAVCDPRRQIQLGNVTVDGSVAVNHSKEWKTIFDLIAEMVSLRGGNILMRYTDGVAYLDYFTSATGVNAEDVQYGKNLLDLQQLSSSANVFNVIVPTGKDGLTIESINGGSARLENAESIARVGRIEVTRSYDTENPTELKMLAAAELAAGIYDTSTITVDAALLGRVQLGALIPVKSNPHGVNTSLLASEITLNLVDAAGDKMTLGAQLRTMTGQSSPVSNLDTGNASTAAAIAALEQTAAEQEGRISALQTTVAAIPAPSDYIVAQGTSGIWTYRKWASGVAECWGTESYGQCLIDKPHGNLFYQNMWAVDYPFTFAQNPNVQAMNVTGYGLIIPTLAAQSASSITINVISTIKDTFDINIAIYSIGRWK